MSRRRSPFKAHAMLTTLGIITVVTGLWSGWWWVAGQMLHRSLDAWIAAARDQGNDIQFSRLVLGGFPLRIRATITDVAVVRRDGLAWRGPELVIEAPLWRVNTLHLSLGGRQEVRLPNDLETTMVITVAGGSGAVTLGGATGFTEARATLKNLVVLPSETSSLPVTVATLDLTASIPEAAVATPGETGLTVTLDAGRIQLPPDETLPLGPGIESLAVAARVLGVPPRLTPANLTAWSRAGGALALDNARLRWGPLTLGAEGTLKLDRDLQPEGGLTAEIAGFGPAIDALIAAGWVKAKQGQTAKAIFNGLAPRRDGANGRDAEPTARIPVSLHDHFLHLGPFRLLSLPIVVWGSPAAG